MSTRAAISLARSYISLASNLSNGHSFNSDADRQILKSFSVAKRLSKAPVIIKVIWKAPSFNWLKCNTDSSAKGNSGMVACSKYWNFLCFLC